MIGEYVEYKGEIYVVVMIGVSYYGVVTLRSRACSQNIVAVVEQECVSIVKGSKRTLLIAIYGEPSSIVEYLVGNIL